MADVYMAGDLRNNTTFELDGNVFKVVEFQHVKPGKGAAFVRVKMKNVISGAVIERTFNPSEKLQGAEIEKRAVNDNIVIKVDFFFIFHLVIFKYPNCFLNLNRARNNILYPIPDVSRAYFFQRARRQKVRLLCYYDEIQYRHSPLRPCLIWRK